MRIPAPYDLAERLLPLLELRAQREVDVCAAVICDCRSMAFAEAAGAHAGLFAYPDLNLIYRACDLGREMERFKLLRVIRAALKDAEHWDPTGPLSFCGRWNDESLALLADAAFFCRSAITRDVARLIAIDSRLRRIETVAKTLNTLVRDAASAEGPMYAPQLEPPQ